MSLPALVGVDINKSNNNIYYYESEYKNRGAFVIGVSGVGEAIIPPEVMSDLKINGFNIFWGTIEPETLLKACIEYWNKENEYIEYEEV